LIDHRAHGESEGKTISFGILERFDVIDWINYLISRFGRETSIFLYGISMGAATVLMAAGEDLPECVKGVVADCPYIAPIDIIVKVGREMGLPGFLVKPLAIVGARVYGGFSLTSCDPISAVRRAKIPILLIHGELDTFVPEYMSEKISKQNTKIIYKKFAEADHAASYLCDTDAYVSLVNGFLYENI
jgi:pimeloyl-ACP methyl ester carboxylesterase